MSDDPEIYDAVMTEAAYWHTLRDFIAVCQSQGYYSAINDLIDACPVYEKGMLLDAIQAIAAADGNS